MNNRFSIADMAVAIAAGIVLLSVSHALIGAADSGSKSSDTSEDAKAKARRAFLGGARAKSMRLQSATKSRGIHQQMIVYAFGNNEFYPGRTAKGDNAPAIEASRVQYGAAAPTRDDQSIVLAILLNNDCFEADYLISPLELQAPQADGPTKSDKIETAPLTRTQSFTLSPTNCSFAMLSWTAIAKDGTPSRRDEWYSTQNSLTPIIADRSKKIADNVEYTSVLSESTSDKSSDWRGNITWNDNHTPFEETGVLAGDNIKIGKLQGEAKSPDDIFLDAAAGPLTKEANVVFSYTK